jgi:hypothetical protein
VQANEAAPGVHPAKARRIAVNIAKLPELLQLKTRSARLRLHKPTDAYTKGQWKQTKSQLSLLRAAITLISVKLNGYPIPRYPLGRLACKKRPPSDGLLVFGPHRLGSFLSSPGSFAIFAAICRASSCSRASADLRHRQTVSSNRYSQASHDHICRT